MAYVGMDVSGNGLSGNGREWEWPKWEWEPRVHRVVHVASFVLCVAWVCGLFHRACCELHVASHLLHAVPSHRVLVAFYRCIVQ